MSLLYNFDIDTPEDILQLLACNLQKRRLEKGLSRDAYSKDVKALLAEPLYSTMEELDVINKNKNRKRGRNEISK